MTPCCPIDHHYQGRLENPVFHRRQHRRALSIRASPTHRGQVHHHCHYRSRGRLGCHLCQNLAGPTGLPHSVIVDGVSIGIDERWIGLEKIDHSILIAVLDPVAESVTVGIEC